MIDTDALRPVLESGFSWLYDTVQPDDAWITHHGITLRVGDSDRRVQFCPHGPWGDSPGRTVIVLEVAGEHIHKSTDPSSDDYWLRANGFEVGELDRFADVVTSMGRHVVSRWNGQQWSESGSLGLADIPHASLRAAYRRYSAGCLEHPRETVFCACPAWRAGFGRAVRPAPVLAP